MTKKNGQKESKEKTPRPSIGFTKEGYNNYEALRIKFGTEKTNKKGEKYIKECKHEDLMNYLVGLANSKARKGQQYAEDMIFRCLYFGEKKEITSGLLRRKLELVGTPVNLATIKNLMKDYEDEINKHNSSL